MKELLLSVVEYMTLRETVKFQNGACIKKCMRIKNLEKLFYFN